jgi:hypothetical protein
MLNSHYSPTGNDIEQLWNDFGVNSEEELDAKLLTSDDWCIEKCRNCGYKINLVHCHYSHNGNVICPSCGREVG